MAATVAVLLGQCGVQLGDALYGQLDGRLPDDPAVRSRFFRGPGRPRAVLIDMERKAVDRAARRFDRRAVVSRRSGSANNWAHGYNVHGQESSIDEVRDAVRLQAEACDRLGSFLVVQSLAGGTGSGYGTRVTELLRDEYRPQLLLNQVVWPYRSGEVIVQNYNTVLTLAHLCDASDALLLTENDQVHALCAKVLGISKVTFAHLNDVIARGLCHTLLPSTVHGRTGGVAEDGQSRSLVPDLVRHLCPHPSLKLLTARTVPQMPVESRPFSTYRWTAILKDLRQQAVTDQRDGLPVQWSAAERPCRALASAVFLRGADTTAAAAEAWKTFGDAGLYSSIALDPLRVRVDSAPFDQHEKSASLLTNSQSAIAPLDDVLGRAYKMFATKAYLYQYQRHGVDETDFAQCFARAEEVLEAYRQLYL